MKALLTKAGRKFIGLLITFVFLFVGLLLVRQFQFTRDVYEVYAKWLMIGYGFFAGANGVITVSSLLSNNNKNSNNK